MLQQPDATKCCKTNWEREEGHSSEAVISNHYLALAYCKNHGQMHNSNLKQISGKVSENKRCTKCSSFSFQCLYMFRRHYLINNNVNDVFISIIHIIYECVQCKYEQHETCAVEKCPPPHSDTHAHMHTPCG